MRSGASHGHDGHVKREEHPRPWMHTPTPPQEHSVAPTKRPAFAAVSEERKAERLLAMIHRSHKARNADPRFAHTVLKDPLVPQVDPLTADSLLRVQKLLRDMDDDLVMHQRDQEGRYCERLNLDELRPAHEQLSARALEAQQQDNSFWNGVPVGAGDGAAGGHQHDPRDSDAPRTKVGVRGALLVSFAPRGVDMEADVTITDELREESGAVTHASLPMGTRQSTNAADAERPRDFFEVGAPQESSLSALQRAEEQRTEREDQLALVLAAGKADEDRFTQMGKSFERRGNTFSAVVAQVNQMLSRCKSLAELIMYDQNAICDALSDHFGLRVGTANADGSGAQEDAQARHEADQPGGFSGGAGPRLSPLAARHFRSTVTALDNHACEMRRTLARCTQVIQRLSDEVATRDDSIAAVEAKLRVASEALLSSNLERDEYKREMWARRVVSKMRGLVFTKRERMAQLYGITRQDSSTGSAQQSAAVGGGMTTAFSLSAPPAAAPSITSRRTSLLPSPRNARVTQTAEGGLDGHDGRSTWSPLHADRGENTESPDGDGAPTLDPTSGQDVGDCDVVLASIVCIAVARYAEAWEQFPSVMPAATEMLCEAINRCVLLFDGAVRLYRSHGSVNFAGDGGYHMLLFRTPEDATSFSLGLQYALNYLPWPSELTRESSGHPGSSIVDDVAGTVRYDADAAGSLLGHGSEGSADCDSLLLSVKYTEQFGTAAGADGGFDYAPFKAVAQRMINRMAPVIGAAGVVALEQALQTSTTASTAFLRPLQMRGLRVKIGIHVGMVFIEGLLAEVDARSPGRLAQSDFSRDDGPPGLPAAPGRGSISDFETTVAQAPPHGYGRALMVASMLCGAARGGETLCSTAVHRALARARTIMGESAAPSQGRSYLQESGVFCRPMPCVPSLVAPQPPSNMWQHGLPAGVGTEAQSDLLNMAEVADNAPQSDLTKSTSNLSKVHLQHSPRTPGGVGISFQSDRGLGRGVAQAAKYFGVEKFFEDDELIYQLFSPHHAKRALLLGEMTPTYWKPSSTVRSGSPTPSQFVTLPRFSDCFNVNWFIRFNPAPSLPVCLMASHRAACALKQRQQQNVGDDVVSTASSEQELLLDEDDKALLFSGDPRKTGVADPSVTCSGEVALLGAHLRLNEFLVSSMRRALARTTARAAKQSQCHGTLEQRCMLQHDWSPLRHAAGVLRTGSVHSARSQFEFFVLLSARHAALEGTAQTPCFPPTYVRCSGGGSGGCAEEPEPGRASGVHLLSQLSMTARSLSDEIDEHVPWASTCRRAADAGLGQGPLLSSNMSSSSEELAPTVFRLISHATPLLLGNELLAMMQHRSQRDASRFGWASSKARRQAGGSSGGAVRRRGSMAHQQSALLSSSTASLLMADEHLEDSPNRCFVFPYLAVFAQACDAMLSAFESIDSAVGDNGDVDVRLVRRAVLQLQHIDGLCGDGSLADTRDREMCDAAVPFPRLLVSSSPPTTSSVCATSAADDCLCSNTSNDPRGAAAPSATSSVHHPPSSIAAVKGAEQISAAEVVGRCEAALKVFRCFAKYVISFMLPLVSLSTPACVGGSDGRISALSNLGSLTFATQWNSFVASHVVHLAAMGDAQGAALFEEAAVLDASRTGQLLREVEASGRAAHQQSASPANSPALTNLLAGAVLNRAPVLGLGAAGEEVSSASKAGSRLCALGHAILLQALSTK